MGTLLPCLFSSEEGCPRRKEEKRGKTGEPRPFCPGARKRREAAQQLGPQKPIEPKGKGDLSSPLKRIFDSRSSFWPPIFG